MVVAGPKYLRNKRREYLKTELMSLNQIVRVRASDISIGT
jgi:hypothetical protein